MNSLDQAIASDIEYFRLAAETEPLPGATLLWMPGLEALASASAVVQVNPDQPPSTLIEAMERTGKRLGLAAHRCYLTQRQPVWEQALSERGYVMQEECVLLAGSTVRADWPRDHGLHLTAITDTENWRERQHLFETSIRAPDGRTVDSAAFIHMEQRKAEAGNLMFYLARDAGGEVVASVGAMVCGDIFRLKNLIVHAHHRGRGIATRLVAACHDLAPPASILVAYELPKPDRPSLYRRMGFLHAGSIYDWTKTNRHGPLETALKH